MKPIKFKQANKKLSHRPLYKDQECLSLWIYSDGYHCLSCWKMSLKQRLSALFFGRVWVCVLSGHTQPPIWVDCTKTVFIEKKEEAENE